MSRIKYPKRLRVTLTADDRKNAGPYMDPAGCILCTALKRMGYPSPRVYYIWVKIGRYRYKNADDFNVSGLVRTNANPFKLGCYKPTVVGKTATLVRTDTK